MLNFLSTCLLYCYLASTSLPCDCLTSCLLANSCNNAVVFAKLFSGLMSKSVYFAVKCLPDPHCLLSYIHYLQQTQRKNPEQRNKRPRSSKPDESSAHADAVIQDERSLTGKLLSSTSKDISVSEVTVGMNSDTSIATAINPGTGAKQKAVEHQIKDSVSNDPELISNKFQDCKKQKMLSAMDVANASTDTIPEFSRITSIKCSHEDIHELQKNEFRRNAITLGEANEQAKEKTSPSDIGLSCDNLKDTGRSNTVEVTELSTSKLSAETVSEPVEETSGSSEWKLMEKELYMKGIEIFGRNRRVLTLSKDAYVC